MVHAAGEASCLYKTDFERWCESLRQVCGDLDAEHRTHVGFDGRVRPLELLGYSAVEVACNAHRVTRSYRAAQAADPMYFLVVQLDGASHMIQGNDEARLDAGAMTIIRAEAPSEFLFEGSSRQLSVHIPRRLVEARALGRPVRAARVLSGDFGAGRVLRSILASAEGDRLTAGTTGLLAAHFIDLVACLAVDSGTLWTDSALPGRSKRSDIHLDQLIDVIEHRLSDPELTIDAVAERYGLSIRHFQRLLAGSGTTFSRLIKERRLARCADDMQKPHLRPSSITDIAFSWGFNDMTHFSRAFRQKYGRSPREFRRGSDAVPAPGAARRH